ncbi:uncharacterized protein LOC135491186 [Lineus longissimus]|uniref:uncharacterized protein LOC135491186 n=1 Tax=Lineus longissimus TaxID=88925 RepID=UPI002B4F92C7
MATYIVDPHFRRGRFSKMPFSNYTELNTAATELLKHAVIHERARHWSKAVQCYRRLALMITRENFPPNYVPRSGYGLLLYEVHFHLGWALQQLGEDRKAVRHYTKSLDAIGSPKNGCAAGCFANSCLMTPVFARRAFAYARIGDFRHAGNDAENAVILDNKNPDVFCIRALVRSSEDKDKEALRDLHQAIKLNRKHLCALILRGSLDKNDDLSMVNNHSVGDEVKKTNTDHEVATKTNPECRYFLDVTSFKHPNIMDFFQRFLFSLNIPHIVVHVDVRPDNSNGPTKSNKATNGFVSPMKFLQPSQESETVKRPWRCGTTAITDYDSDGATRRRGEYGDVVRQFALRPRTAEESIEKLKNDLKMKALRQTYQYASEKNSRLSRKSGSTESVEEREQPRSRSTVPVFQSVNIKDAPRMYYRPWAGDRIPVAEVNRPQSLPIFR